MQHFGWPSGVVGDGIHDAGPGGARKVMSHARDLEEPGPRNRSRGGPPGRRRDQGIVEAVDHHGGDPQSAQRGRPIA